MTTSRVAAHAVDPASVMWSPDPEVVLENAFQRPFENAVATARTCYSSKGIVHADEVSGEELPTEAERAERRRKRDDLALSIYRAGHHTTLQHCQFQFAISGVSRQFIWSFLHAHPFYNSEQVSQRYVKVKPGSYAIPPLTGRAREQYVQICDGLQRAYAELTQMLLQPAAAEYDRRFPARRRSQQARKYDKDIQKKAQEVARYVLPLGTLAYLYHSVSGLTLLRYHRMQNSPDTTTEQRVVVGKMIGALIKLDPLFAQLLEQPIVLEDSLEHAAAVACPATAERRAEFAREFDLELGGRRARLVAYHAGAERVLADAVREVLGVPAAALSDAAAIARVLDPSQNSYLGSTLNLAAHSKLMRALVHVTYTFKKKLSHTADSQDQRHRMVPGSRPVLSRHLGDAPDYVTPGLIASEPRIRAHFDGIMQRLWADVAELRRLGASDEFALYALPNAIAVRFTESGDLQNLHHKWTSRLCYNAQEEIFAASLDEVQQVAAVHPEIARFLLAPCGLRVRAGIAPYCPEGERYCGVPVWKLKLDRYQRVI
ncbi:MAG: FAD-dependent thymidylate synthase [Planctomycetota bacterium]